MKTETNELRKLIGNITLKTVMPKRSLNDIYVKEGKEGLTKLLSENTFEKPTSLSIIQDEEAQIIDTFAKPKIEIVYEGKLLLKNKLNDYYVLGLLTQDLSVLPITLTIEERSTGRKERTKIDLYEREAIRYLSSQIAELLLSENEQIESEIITTYR